MRLNFWLVVLGNDRANPGWSDDQHLDALAAAGYSLDLDAQRVVRRWLADERRDTRPPAR